MTEGRKCFIAERNGITASITSIDYSLLGAIEGRAFTLAELEEMKAEIHAQGFAAGVEAAAKEADFCECAVLASIIRALLPPDYKSHAEIRREALEEFSATLKDKVSILRGVGAYEEALKTIDSVCALAEGGDDD